MAQPSLDDLPDLCLLALFQYVHLLELLRTIRLVNIRWSRLTSAELNRRRSLVIVDNRTFDLSRLQLDQYGSRLIEHVRRDDGLTTWARLPHIDHRNVINRNNRYTNGEDYRDYHDQVPPEMITTLMASLPRITNLSVVQRFLEFEEMDQVIRMIDLWRDDLVTLKLSLNEQVGIWLKNGNPLPDDYHEQTRAQIVKLFESINKLASLKHLKLAINLYGHNDITSLPPLTVLSQLSSFHTGYLFRNLLDRTLLHNASGNGQLQIATGILYSLDLLLRIDRQFWCKFIEIGVEDMLTTNGDRNLMLTNMNRLCVRFSSLTHLTLWIGAMPALTILSRPLSRLTQLNHLTLCVFVLFGYADENPEDTIVPVPSVRLITLELRIDSHTNTERLHLPEIFPNLQVLSITDYNQYCYACELDTDGGLEEGYEQFAPELRQCAQLARAPFRACPNLHTIEIDANDSYFLSEGMSKKLITRDEL